MEIARSCGQQLRGAPRRCVSDAGLRQGYADEALRTDLVLLYPQHYDAPPVAHTWELTPGRRLRIWTIPVGDAHATTSALAAMEQPLRGTAIDPSPSLQ